MVTESKGRAWFGKLYNKLETILVEVDSFTSQSTLCLKSSDPPGLDSVIGEPKEVAEDRSSGTSIAQDHHDHVDSPSCKSPFDPPSHQNFDIPGHVRVEARVQGDSFEENLVQGDSFKENSSASSLSDGEVLSTSPLLEEYCDANLTSETALGDEATIFTDDESQITSTSTSSKFSAGNSSVFSGEESVEEVRVESSLPDGERLSTSSLLEDYCDANLTSATTLGDEEPITTDEESQITNTSTSQDFSAGNSSVFSGEESVEEVRVESSLPDGERLSTSSLLEDYCDASLTSTNTLGEEEPIITDEESQITNTSTPQKFSAGNSSVFSGEESVEEFRTESCRDVVSTDSQSTQSSLESFGTVVECNGDPVVAELGISTDDSNLNPLATKIPDVTVQDNVANMRSSNADNPDDVINGKSDVAPLDTNAFYGIEFREDPPSYVDNNALYATRVRTIAPLDTNALYGIKSREDPSYVDDSALHAMRLRTKKLRSFKRKILDALTSKRRREKEYEQLAIWFGDANMGSDLATEEDSIQTEAMDSKSSQVLGSEDSQWELL